MTNSILYETALAWGSPGERNPLSRPEKDVYSVIGYNATENLGLIDVCKGDKTPVLEGKVDLGDLLSGSQSEDPEGRYSRVEEYVMQAYHNGVYKQEGSIDFDPLSPVMEFYHSD